ncbi:MAG: glutamine synthetase [Bacteroidales bacterium]|nr:glutamine synthetase [Bacteroidales bacterium]MBN2755767.1 glutamine synthetase [Bacteroidales bacterium]
MKEREVLLNPNKLVRYLKKPAAEFTKHDLIQFIDENNIELLNFRYVGEDGKLKTLNFVITSKEYLDSILSTGERVDGSSLFSFIEADRSDLYVIPRFKTAFVDPFTELPTLNILCSFYTADGLPLESAPEYILKKAHQNFKEKTGYEFRAMGELEYYVSSSKGKLYPAQDQKGYHTSAPFSNWEHLRIEAMQLIAQSGGKIKYGHSEVGNFSTETEDYEQHEIEFMPVDAEDAVDQLVIAKWILRMLGQKHNVQISFAPKITVGKAGSGLHIHMMLVKDDENAMIKDFALSDVAKKMIAGLLELAKPLTAFGNTIPTSYLRLVPHQEAPTKICWGDTNRSVLVRVPLGWVAETSMIKNANPQEIGDIPYIPGKQTVEFRVPDGSADLYHLMAGLIVAAKNGLLNKNSLKRAEELYVNVNIFAKGNEKIQEKLEDVPKSCWDSANCLEKHRHYFEEDNIFPEGTIDRFISSLKAFDDKDLSERLYGKKDEIKELVAKFIHCA